MSGKIYTIRERYGGVFVTTFPDGMSVPWKPLSLGDYILYSRDQARGLIPSFILENEIFRKCVLDQSLVRSMDSLRAGIVSTVCQNIWEHSGPSGISQFNEDLEAARTVMFGDGTRAIHDLVQLITLAYPYKPEEIYSMDYETFMLRLVQAEKKLLEMKMITEPVTIRDSEEKKQVPSKPKERIDAKKIWEEQQKRTVTEAPITRSPVSPVLEFKPTHNIDFNTEGKEQEVFASTGWEKEDMFIEKGKMVKDAEIIYADLIAKLREKRNKGQ